MEKMTRTKNEWYKARQIKRDLIEKRRTSSISAKELEQEMNSSMQYYNEVTGLEYSDKEPTLSKYTQTINAPLLIASGIASVYIVNKIKN